MARTYEERTKRSWELFEKAGKIFAGGVNHNARYYEPYPLAVSRAKGKWIWDEDGNRYVDYWMGHTALILGHSPRPVVSALEAQLGEGTLFGMGSRLSVELGELISQSVKCAEMMRFCNTGAEATMYLVRLARAFTGKRGIVKMAGGWHGYNTELNRAVHRPFDKAEGAGILEEEQAHVKAVPFNDLRAAEGALRDGRGDTAAVLLEPVLGAGGCIPADREYLKELREITDRHGVLLAFDEVITGFRLALGGAQEFFGVVPDVATFGKIAGGGLPLGLVCGKKEVLSLADPSRKGRLTSIGGGTFSENPLTMTAGLATLSHLRDHATKIYPRLEELGSTLRQEVDAALQETGVEAHTTGAGSLFGTHFGSEPKNAEEAGRQDKEVARRYSIHLMEKGAFILPGHLGALSTLHTREDVHRLAVLSHQFGVGLRQSSRGGPRRRTS
jgi:glutamate-1-semialdehyde 2,1-aminomutase